MDLVLIGFYVDHESHDNVILIGMLVAERFNP